MPTDPGPLARLKQIVSEPGAMSEIVQRITDGEQLKEIARVWEVPYGKLAEWIIDDAERTEQVSRATRMWIDSEARRVVEIADNADTTKSGVAHAKLKVDSRLRLAAKLYPDQYGDRTNLNVAVKDERSLDREMLILEAARGVAFLLAQGANIAAGREAQKQIAGPVIEPVTERDGQAQP